MKRAVLPIPCPLVIFSALNYAFAFDQTSTLTAAAVPALLLGAPSLVAAFAALEWTQSSTAGRHASSPLGFLVLFLLPAATLHAVLAGKASFKPSAAPVETIQIAYHHF